jgi:hypothetical protein
VAEAREERPAYDFRRSRAPRATSKSFSCGIRRQAMPARNHLSERRVFPTAFRQSQAEVFASTLRQTSCVKRDSVAIPADRSTPTRRAVCLAPSDQRWVLDRRFLLPPRSLLRSDRQSDRPTHAESKFGARCALTLTAAAALAVRIEGAPPPGHTVVRLADHLLRDAKGALSASDGRENARSHKVSSLTFVRGGFQFALNKQIGLGSSDL